MRSPGLTPSAASALATRLVRISNSTKLVRRPSNSNAMASPRLFARAPTMSARLAGSCEADMFLPEVCYCCAEFGVISRQKQYDNSPPCRAVLFVLRLDRVTRPGPVGIGPVAQLIKVTAGGQ